MPSTARQLRQPPTIKAIGRVPYFANETRGTILDLYYNQPSLYTPPWHIQLKARVNQAFY